MDAQSIIRQNAAFSRLSDQVIEHLASVSSIGRLQRGEALWRAGEKAQSFIIVAHGLVKVVLPSTGSRDLVMGLYGPGETVGDESVLEAATHPAEALALTNPVTVLRIPREDAVRALDQSGPAALILARAMGQRAAATNRRVSLFASSAEERLASTMIPLRLTRAELAALVGTTVETTIRTLSRWSREGLVSTIDGGFTVHDPTAFARRSAGSLATDFGRETLS